MLLAAAFIARRGISPSAAEDGPKGCLGVDFDVKRPLVASKVTAKRTYFVKSAREDASCPAEDAACQGKAFLVRGDVVRPIRFPSRGIGSASGGRIRRATKSRSSLASAAVS
jgi:hypothetical protein